MATYREVIEADMKAGNCTWEQAALERLNYEEVYDADPEEGEDTPMAHPVTDSKLETYRTLLETLRTYLPEGATVYTMDVLPKAVRNYTVFYCVVDGKIYRLTGMLVNFMQHLGYEDVRYDHGNWQRHAALVTRSFITDREIVQRLATVLYGNAEALKLSGL